MKNDINPLDSNDFEKSFLLMDAKLLPLMDEAESGCLHSQMLLADAFSKGNGAKQDNVLLAKYEQLIYDTTEDNTIKLAVLWSRAMQHKDRGDLKDMKESFHRIVVFMQENMPIEEWDFSLFALMDEFIKLQ